MRVRRAFGEPSLRDYALGSLAGLLVCTSAQAQVLEIGADGKVDTYAGPAVFTDAGVTAIRTTSPQPPHRRSGRRPASLPASDGAQVVRAAGAADISPALVQAVAWRESGFRTDRVSSAGAVGEMQLMGPTARELGVDPADPAQNLKGGASYLGRLMRRYDGDLVRALAAYNAGPGAVDRFRGVPPYKETQAYVAAVLERLSEAVAPASPAPSHARPAS